MRRKNSMTASGEKCRFTTGSSRSGGYIYVAPRAPNDTWNGFYDDYVYPLIANLVHQFLLFGDVNPDKVFDHGLFAWWLWCVRHRTEGT